MAIGMILGFLGYGAMEMLRAGARRGLFKTMLEKGFIKGADKGLIATALKEGGGKAASKAFNKLYKQSAKQVNKFARKATGKGGDAFIARKLQGKTHGWSGLESPIGVIEKANLEYAQSSLVGQAWKHQYVGGAGAMAAGIGLIGMGSMVGGGVADMAYSEVPAPSQEIQNANMYIMPRQAYTQRQRSLQAIMMTQMNTRSAFGQEAMYQHR